MSESVKDILDKLNELESGLSSKNQASIWGQYNSIYSKMSSDQQAFVLNTESVKNAEAKLLVGFNLYLFEKFKDDFALFQNKKYQVYIEEYINNMTKSAAEYSEKAKNLLEENAAKDAEISQLKEKLASLEEKENVRKY